MPAYTKQKCKQINHKVLNASKEIFRLICSLVPPSDSPWIKTGMFLKLFYSPFSLRGTGPEYADEFACISYWHPSSVGQKVESTYKVGMKKDRNEIKVVVFSLFFVK